MLADEHVSSWQITWLRNAFDTGELRRITDTLPETPDMHIVAQAIACISEKTNMKELDETVMRWLFEAYGLISYVIETPFTMDYELSLEENIVKYFGNPNSLEFEAAVDDLTKAIQLDPSNSDYYHIRGSSYYCLKRYDKMVADYNVAIQLAPNNADYYYWRGFCLFSNAIKLDSVNAKYFYERDKCFYTLSELE